MEPTGLHLHIIDTSALVWRRAKKTMGLKAKPMSALLDGSIANRFLVDTLEGREPVDAAAIFCIGEAGDAWQQAPKALLRKYDIQQIDSDGWMHCIPKPENEVEFVESQETGWIQGIWGETVGGREKLQSVKKGDFICRQPHEHPDQWRVYRKLFLNTYAEILADGSLAPVRLELDQVQRLGGADLEKDQRLRAAG